MAVVVIARLGVVNVTGTLLPQKNRRSPAIERNNRRKKRRSECIRNDKTCPINIQVSTSESGVASVARQGSSALATVPSPRFASSLQPQLYFTTPLFTYYRIPILNIQHNGHLRFQLRLVRQRRRDQVHHHEATATRSRREQRPAIDRSAHTSLPTNHFIPAQLLTVPYRKSTSTVSTSASLPPARPSRPPKKAVCRRVWRSTFRCGTLLARATLRGSERRARSMGRRRLLL